MSSKLVQMLFFSLLGAGLVALIGMGMDSVINNLDDMLVPCQHGTQYNKLSQSCMCEGTPFSGKYCGECACEFGQCMLGGTTKRAGSDYGCRCPYNTKRFGFLCNLCFATDQNTTCASDECLNGFHGPLCDKTCAAALTFNDLFTPEGQTCRTLRDNGGVCNMCNGHGACSETGDCDCDANWFGGPDGDCSVTCPAPDGTVCSGHGVCTDATGQPSCSCEFGWRGDDCSLSCPGIETTGRACSGHGNCLIDVAARTTECACNQKFRGDACEIECPGEVVACTGHGTCDDEGVCECQSEGVPWTGAACSCSDLITCSGNGACVGGVCECSGNFAGAHCKQCKQHYHGSQCQFYCDPDTTCHGRGQCTVFDFNKESERIACVCTDSATTIFDDGKQDTYRASYEEAVNCLDCEPGFLPSVAVSEQHPFPDGIYVPCQLFCAPKTCNNLGVCNEAWGTPNEPLCHCDDGPNGAKHLDDDNFCVTCEANWFPESPFEADGCTNFCVSDLIGSFPAACAEGSIDCVQCSGHGQCGADGACLCDDGYTGTECNIQCVSENGLTCSGHGQCVVNPLQELLQFELQYENASGALYSCECDPQDLYSKEERENFIESVANNVTTGELDPPPTKTFFGETCQYACKSPQWLNAEVCNAVGECVVNAIEDPNGGFTTCLNDEECTGNSALMGMLSGEAGWSNDKGPFCHKGDVPLGCPDTNLTNDDCETILTLHRPVAARSKECMREETCRAFMDGHDWQQWCDQIDQAKHPLACESDSDVYCADPEIPALCSNVVAQLTSDHVAVNEQLHYCYEKDKARYPFEMSDSYRFSKGIEKHDAVAEAFVAFHVKHPTVTMDATGFCEQRKKRNVEVSHVRTNTLYLCNGKVQHACDTEALALDTVWRPFAVRCAAGETVYRTLEEAIANRNEGCVIVEEAVDVTNATLETLNSVQSIAGGACVVNEDCVGNVCFEGTCCAISDTTNCAKCTETKCACVDGASWNGTHCAEGACPGYFLENIGCVNASAGAACSAASNCASGSCLGGVCCAEARDNYATCDGCIAGSTLVDGACVPGVCAEGMWVTNEGCVARPSDALETTVQALLEATCTNAASVFPSCNEPANACEIDPCNDGDTCEASGRDAICKTTGDLNATCKYGLTVERLSFSSYRCVGTFVQNEACLDHARETDWFAYCAASDPVKLYDNFGADAVQENHQPPRIQTLKHDGNRVSFHVKTQSTASLLAKHGDDEVFRVYLHQQQVQLNEIEALDACPVDEPECNDAFLYEPNVWLSVEVELDYSQLEVTLVYNGNRKTRPFLCESCSAGITDFYIAGAFYDELVFYKTIDPPAVATTCSDYPYCDFDVDYTRKCLDLLLNVRYPTTVEPQGDIVETCSLRRVPYGTGTVAEKNDMDLLDWATYCDFLNELDESIDCNGLRHTELEPYPECEKWVDPIDGPGQLSCVLSNLQLNWTAQCEAIEDAYLPTALTTECTPACYKHLLGYDQCEARGALFSTLGGCDWPAHCTAVAKGTQPGFCSAIECDCGNEGLSGEACDLYCTPASDGSPCGVDSGMGICRYTDEQKADLANGPYADELFQLNGECQCFLSEGSLSCDQPCSGCNETDYVGPMKPTALAFGNNGVEDFVFEGENDPDIEVCANTETTFSTTGHPLRVVSDCDSCASGFYDALPNSSWPDVTLNNSQTITLAAGVYYYVCRSHPNMVGKITVRACGGSIGICDGSRGLCQCLAPYVKEHTVNFVTWKGDTRSRIERRYDMPEGVTADEELRIRMMQGKEALVGYLDPSATESNWRIAYEAFQGNPSQYTCAGKPCDFHDVVLSGTLAGSSFSYDYDCSKACPAVDETTKLPCSGHGRCGVTGQCICDIAKRIRGTDSASGSTFKINVFNGEDHTDSKLVVSKLDQTGWRGEDCSIKCPGYDEERLDMTEVCSGHGVCNMDGECQCDMGYTGEVCQFVCPGYKDGDKNICSGHGTCGLSEIQVFTDIFAEFNETYYVSPGTTATRTTNEQRMCPISASREVCLGYSIIHDIGFLDVARTTLIKEDSLCGSPSMAACKKWKDYQNIEYTNRHPFAVNDPERPSGCVLDGNTVMYNEASTQVTCVEGCLCEQLDVVGVCSIHDYYPTEDGYRTIEEWDGYRTNTNLFPDLSMSPYECAFYADKVLELPYVDVTTGAPSMEVTQDECEAWTVNTLGASLYEVVTNDQLPSGCLKLVVNDIIMAIQYNTLDTSRQCGFSVSDQVYRCVEKPFETLSDATLPTGCIVESTPVYNTNTERVRCSANASCVEKQTVDVTPMVVFHTEGGNDYIKEVGKYSTNPLSNVLFGPATEEETKAYCEGDPDCGGYFPEVPDVEGTYLAISKYGNSLIQGKTESYRLAGLTSECVGEIDYKIHFKRSGTSSLNKGALTLKGCTDYALTQGIWGATDHYGSYPPGCVHDTNDDRIYYNKMSASTVDCSAAVYCIETASRHKRVIGAPYLDDHDDTDGTVSSSACSQWKTDNGHATFTDSTWTTQPSGCTVKDGAVYYNRDDNQIKCGTSNFLCVKAPGVPFARYTITSIVNTPDVSSWDDVLAFVQAMDADLLSSSEIQTQQALLNVPVEGLYTAAYKSDGSSTFVTLGSRTRMEFELKAPLSLKDNFGFIQTTTNMLLFDQDNDGDMDVAWTNGNGGFMTINNVNAFSEGTFNMVHGVIGDYRNMYYVEDRNGDGYDDIRFKASTYVGWLVNTQTKTYLDQDGAYDFDQIEGGDSSISFGDYRWGIPDPQGEPVKAKFMGDIDSWVTAGTGVYHLWRLVEGSYNWQSTRIAAINVDKVKAGDMDADNDIDIVVKSGWGTYATLLFIENTDGFMTADVQPTAQVTVPNLQDYYIGDIDGNGMNDVVCTTSEGIVWYELVMGGFGPQRSVGPLVALNIVVADVDQDGDNDIIAATDTTISWFLNTGNGAFLPEKNVTVSGQPRKILMGNINNDGLDDVVLLTEDDVVYYETNIFEVTENTPLNKTIVAFTNVDVDNDNCARVCRSHENCVMYSVDSKCHMHDGCTDVSNEGSDRLYQLQSASSGRQYHHFKKSKPALCMSEDGRMFDEKTQAPVIRSITKLTEPCPPGDIWSEYEEMCVPIASTPKFAATFFLDKGTDDEIQLNADCQILSETSARCALCSCFNSYLYGHWSGFSCETCSVGYGKSQCRRLCPDFDGANKNSMCGGAGRCLFGSTINEDNGERLFQEAKCVCGQDTQYEQRQPDEEVVGYFENTGGEDNDGAINGYFYLTPVPYRQSYASLYDAQAKCSEFNDVENTDRGGFCFGVYRKFLSSTSLSPTVHLVMGYVGGNYYLYGKFWEKQATSGYTKVYDFKTMELYTAVEGLPRVKTCNNILSIRSEGYDTCNHFSTEDENPSCDQCQPGWSGKNCRYVCSNCLLGGACVEAPSDSTASTCDCISGSGALWEHQCCPVGFMVADKATWQSKSKEEVASIRLNLEYDSSTTNELDASYYCKTCPGISHVDWMNPNALYKVCSGPTRGTCEQAAGTLELACNCKINAVSKNRWLGRACACDESIAIGYNSDPTVAESTDYGCSIPTKGQGVCPAGTGVELYFKPPKVWSQDATYITGYPYGTPFYGGIAGVVYAKRTLFCSPSSPCHTGEGHCNADEDCAGTLKCFQREGEDKIGFNNEKISFDMNYCYHEEETLVGCHPAFYTARGEVREYNTQFYWDAPTNSFKAPTLGSYVPYTIDANLEFVIHQQAFQCPKGRYGVTVPNDVTYEKKYNGICSGIDFTKVYEGDGDNPGALVDQAARCFDACMNKKDVIYAPPYVDYSMDPLAALELPRTSSYQIPARGDLNGDGRLDVVMSYRWWGYNKMFWWQNNGNSWTRHEVTMSVPHIRQIKRGYCSSPESGHEPTAEHIQIPTARACSDLCSSDRYFRHNGGLCVCGSTLPNYKCNGWTGSYSWETGHDYYTYMHHTMLACKLIKTADVDNDGHTDILCVSSNIEDDYYNAEWYRSIIYLRNNGNAASWTPYEVFQPTKPEHYRNNWVGDTYMQVVDVDGNGHKDIIYGGTGQHITYQTSTNVFASPWSASSELTTFGTHTLEYVDFDGDGLEDMVLSGNQYYPNNMRILKSNSRPVFYPSSTPNQNSHSKSFTEVYSNSGAYTHTHTVDVDGDGDLDIVYVKHSPYTTGWLENTGSYTFTDHLIKTFLNSPSDGWQTYVEDGDNDGDLDYYVLGQGPIYYFSNDGTGVFTEYTLAVNYPKGTVGDFTGNGLMEVMVVHGNPKKMYLYGAVYRASMNGEWTFQAESFHVNTDGACWCNAGKAAECTKTVDASYELHDIVSDGEDWNVCDKCPSGKYQDTEGNVAWVKTRTGDSAGKSVTKAECETYANWHGLSFHGSATGSCFIRADGVWFGGPGMLRSGRALSADYYPFASSVACSTSSTFSNSKSGVQSCYDRAVSDNVPFFGTTGSWCMTHQTCGTLNTDTTHYDVYTTLNCESNQYIDASEGICKTCPSGETSAGGQVTSCATATYYTYEKVIDNGYCSGGHTSMPYALDNTSPETCFEACKTSSIGFLWLSSGGQCYCSSQNSATCTQTAVANHFRYDITAAPASSGCSNDNICLQYGGKGDRHPNCKNCPAGKFGGPIGNYHESLCEACDPGTVATLNSDTCVPCAAGEYELGGVCLQCPNGQYSGEQHAGTVEQPCNSCPSGRDTNGQIATAGTSIAACTFCQVGQYNAVPGGGCGQCAEGKYAATVGKTNCDNCGVQQFANVPGMTSCLTCGLDYPYVGLYGHTSSRESCQPCSAGQYIGNGQCTDCARGKQQPITYQVVNQCTDCVPGRFAYSTGTGTCTACATGTKQAGSGKYECDDCVAGRYTDQTARTSCLPCVTGTYQTEPKSSSCTSCEVGRFSDTQGQTDCKNCNTQYQDEVGQTGCKSCPSGKFMSAGQDTGYTSIDSCAECPCGHTCTTQGGANPCAVGKYSSGNSGNCIPPSQHYYVPTGGACEQTRTCMSTIFGGAQGQCGNNAKCACMNKNKQIDAETCEGYPYYKEEWYEMVSTQTCGYGHCYEAGNRCGLPYDCNCDDCCILGICVNCNCDTCYRSYDTFMACPYESGDGLAYEKRFYLYNNNC